jgi:hypothetical protein
VVACNGVTATIDNLTITQGNGGTNNGGGVDVATGTLTIDDCTISDNTAYSGGGIAITSDYVNGGFLPAGNLILENSVIAGNVTSETSSGEGGGLYVPGDGEATVLACLFTQKNRHERQRRQRRQQRHRRHRRRDFR